MSVIGTIAMRTDDPWSAFRDALNRIAASPPEERDVDRMLFPTPQRQPDLARTPAA
jgi:hypothetical protein